MDLSSCFLNLSMASKPSSNSQGVVRKISVIENNETNESIKSTQTCEEPAKLSKFMECSNCDDTVRSCLECSSILLSTKQKGTGIEKDEVNSVGIKSFIRYNPKRIDYSLSEEELQLIRTANKNDWKDFSILCFGVGIPCLLNVLSGLYTQNYNVYTPISFANLLIGCIGIILGFIFLTIWKKTETNIDQIFENIKNKPLAEIVQTSVDEEGY